MTVSDPRTHSAQGAICPGVGSTGDVLVRVADAIARVHPRGPSARCAEDEVAAKAAMLALADAIDDAAPIEDTATWLREEAPR